MLNALTVEPCRTGFPSQPGNTIILKRRRSARGQLCRQTRKSIPGFRHATCHLPQTVRPHRRLPLNQRQLVTRAGPDRPDQPESPAAALERRARSPCVILGQACRAEHGALAMQKLCGESIFAARMVAPRHQAHRAQPDPRRILAGEIAQTLDGAFAIDQHVPVRDADVMQERGQIPAGMKCGQPRCPGQRGFIGNIRQVGAKFGHFASFPVGRVLRMLRSIEAHCGFAKAFCSCERVSVADHASE